MKVPKIITFLFWAVIFMYIYNYFSNQQVAKEKSSFQFKTGWVCYKPIIAKCRCGDYSTDIDSMTFSKSYYTKELVNLPLIAEGHDRTDGLFENFAEIQIVDSLFVYFVTEIQGNRNGCPDFYACCMSRDIFTEHFYNFYEKR